MTTDSQASSSPLDKELEYAVFSVGSYWRADVSFGRIPGVIKTWVGLATGENLGPVEAVELWFHPKRVSYHALVRWFWDSINPQKLSENQRYQPAIFTTDEKQFKVAQRSVVEMEFKYKKELSALVQPLTDFDAAPLENQKYYLQNNPKVLAAIQPLFSDPETLLNSTAAARINSFLGGGATLDDLQQQWATVAALPGEPGELQSFLADLEKLTQQAGNPENRDD